MAISGLIAGGVQSALDDVEDRRLKELVRQLQEQQQADQLALQTRQVEGLEDDRRDRRDNERRTIEGLERRRTDDLAREATDRNVGMDAANVLQMPGMTPEARASELQQSVLRNPTAKSGPAMLKVIEGLTRVPDKKYTPPQRLADGSIAQFEEGQIPSGTKFYQEPKSGAPARDPIADYRSRKEIDAEFAKQPTAKPVHPQILEYSRGVIRKIDDLIGRADDPATPKDESKPNRITHGTAGVGGAIRRWSPLNNSAKDVDAELFSLSSELAIAALQKMRASSQTGGGVGNVALGEMEIMKNAEAAIRSDQSPANLRRQLGIIRDSEQRFLDASERQSDPGLNRGIDAKPIPGVESDDLDALIDRLRKPKGQ